MAVLTMKTYNQKIENKINSKNKKTTKKSYIKYIFIRARINKTKQEKKNTTEKQQPQKKRKEKKTTNIKIQFHDC